MLQPPCAHSSGFLKARLQVEKGQKHPTNEGRRADWPRLSRDVSGLLPRKTGLHVGFNHSYISRYSNASGEPTQGLDCGSFLSTILETLKHFHKVRHRVHKQISIQPPSGVRGNGADYVWASNISQREAKESKGELQTGDANFKELPLSTIRREQSILS